MKRFSFIFFLLCFGFALSAQNSAEIDSIFARLNLKFSPEVLTQVKRDYQLANDTVRAIMLKVYSMPMTSRKEMIDNYKERSAHIADLQEEFNMVVPKGYIVDLSIEMENNYLHSIKNIDIQIFKRDGKWRRELVDAEWGVEFDSPRFYELLDIIGWDAMVFSNVKNLMQMANCISVRNDNNLEIGFARSGLGKYTYVIFPENLTDSQARLYNDGCKYIFYKENIVLKYEGGMAGPQCFTD